MKHFVINITYTAKMEIIDEILPEHRKFLQIGYDKGLLLSSGPKNPRVGGIIVARAESAEAIKEFFYQDPYIIGKAAEYEFIEFNPVKHQDFLKDWVND